MLEDELLVVGGKVSFGVLAAKSELTGVLKVLLFRREENLLSCGLLRARGGVREKAEADGSQRRDNDESQKLFIHVFSRCPDSLTDK
jgi:hypothetical protein